ncbi:DUF4347 domain-containing protein [Undibacterium seohonense]|uniref:DUF4347 domain-containing protein n=1 Tax=Undibacterium seohonense TaxID=1344950 RepID=A0ABR6X3A9_9BURK|nr:Ig-like domain-containing protein [Undibacterium seohonense]MBC3807163.1 DUF4347 domain-containing protein [Undibacterium seohonense]
MTKFTINDKTGLYIRPAYQELSDAFEPFGSDSIGQPAHNSPPTESAKREIVFIEDNVRNISALREAIGAGKEIHILDSTRDGLQQIAQILAGQTGIDALHLISHGKAASINLGALILDQSTIDAHASELASIGASLNQNADILLYGCEVGANQGTALLNRLASLTGADIAASNDLTGSIKFAADWDLEISTGNIEASNISNPQLAATYLDVLNINSALITFDNGTGVFTDVGGYANAGQNVAYQILDADPNYVLRIDGLNQGINRDPGNYVTIDFNATNTETRVDFTFAAGQIFDADSLEIWNQTSSPTQNLTFIGLDASDNQIVTQNFTILSGAFVATPITLTGFDGIKTLRIVETGGGNIYYMNLDQIALSNIRPPDTTPPTVTISVSDTAVKVGDTPTVTFTFSEAVTGFSNADVTSIPNGNLSAVSSSDGGITYTATFTPNAGVEDASNLFTVNMTGVADAAANVGVGSTNSNNFSIDTQRPGVTVTLADSNLTAGETTTATFTFTEIVSGFTLADITASGSGSLGALSTSDNITYTATFTPTASTNDATNVITVDKTGVTDAAANAGSGSSSSANYTVNTVRPTVTVNVSDTALQIGDTSLVTFTFSEAVTGFTNADLSIANGSLTAVSSGDGITWTATFTPTLSITDTTNIITVTNSGYTSIASGNTGSGTTNSNNYAIDTERPVLSISLADSNLIFGESSLVTFNFTEAVTSFDNTDITGIPNGSLSAVSSSNGGITWTATYTPNASLQDASNVITVDMTTLTDLAGNAGLGTTDTGNFAIDTLRPDVAITLSDTTLSAGETTTVTFTFTEAVSGFTNADITVEGGTLGTLSTVDNVVYTATFTPTASLLDSTNVITVDKTGVTDTAGNVGSGSSSSANYIVSTVGPTVSATFSDTALVIGDTAVVTFTFSEAVTGFSNADLNVVNGNLSAVGTSDGGITWTANFTPDVSVADATNVITITNSGYTSVASGNAGSGTTDSANYAIDTVRPTATIVVADNSLLAGETSLVTITFNEAVTNFSNADLTIANGTLSVVSSGDGGITWTATLTPTTSVSDTTNLITLDNTTLNDLAGNAGTGTTDSNNYAVQTVRPTVSVTVGDTALQIGDTPTVTFTFSEAVTGFTNADLTIANGTLSPVGSSDGGITWTATLTPTLSIEDTSNLITVTNTGYANAVGNTGTGSTNSNNYAVDTLRPTATIVVADNALKAGETSLVTITFSEAVTGFDNSDLTVANGSLTAVGSSDGGITWTATLTPTVSIEDTTNLINLNNIGVTDAAGNTGSGTTDSNNYAIDTLSPTVSIGVSDTALKTGDTATVTFTFSEAVTNFTNADVSFPNGALGPVSSGDGGTTWTATFTPSADIEDSSNVISVALAGLTDLAGNAGTGTSTSSNYAIDTLRPSIIDIALTDASLTVGETAILSLNFTEAVSGLTIGDITVDNAVPSALSTPDGGTTWNFTVTPNASATNLASFVHVNYANVTDTAGNVGVGIGNFGSFVIDTARPALVGSVTVSDNALKIGDTSTVSFAFTEAVTNLTSADLSTPNGSISNLNSADGGITWTATLTPSISVSDSTNVVTLDLTTITDLRGNAGLGTSSSSNYAVDTVRPALASAITFSDSALAIGETATIGFTFTEAVTGFTTADILSPNGVLSNLITGDGGITWTATFTPSPSTYSATNILTLDYTGIVDLAGNAGSGTATSSNYVVDTVRPTLASAMAISDAALKIGDTATVTFTFTEAVTNFTTADVTVENGVLSNLSTANSGITWTATLTPNASVTDTSNILTLDYTGITDLAGNAGTGSVTSGNYTIDTVRPTVSSNMSFADSALVIGDTSLMTIVFSEAVTGLSTADFTVANGALSALSSSDGGITWTATLTPNASVSDTTNTISLDNTSYTDLNGNAGTGTTVSPNYTIDTLRPTATITLSDNDLSLIDTALVTFTFSEPVIGFTNADLTLPVTTPMGALSPVSSSDGGLTWTATYTPPFGVFDATNLITLDTSGVVDAVGNAGAGNVNSPNFVISTVNIAPSLGGATGGLSTTDMARILPFTGITVTDPDFGAMETAIISIDNVLKGSFTPNSLALSGFYTNDGGVTYLHDAVSPSDMQAAIRALVFEPNPARLSVGTSDVTTFTIVVRDQHLASASNSSTTLTISNVNSAPTDILLSDAIVSQSEGANAIVGTLSAVDRNIGDTHTFSLAAANAFNDNTKFALVGNSLKVINPASMTEKDYFVAVQVTDANGLSFTKKLTVSLDDDIAPYITSIETLRSPRPTITTGSYIVKFNESVTGVSIDDFFLSSSNGTTAHLSSVTALTGNAYRVYFDQIVGTGVLNLNLKTSGTGISDLFGNSLPSAVPLAPIESSASMTDTQATEVIPQVSVVGVQQAQDFIVM